MSRHVHDEQPGNELRRRSFLKLAASVPASYAISGADALAEAPSPLGGLIIREKEPENLEFPFSTLDGFITPNDRFYIRSHFKAPQVDLKSWRLKVEGIVDKPLELTYDELLKMPSRTAPSTLECAGNSRVFLAPAVKGAQWSLGAAGTAEWTGVSLSAVLERAGIGKSAVEVVLEGADEGEIKDPPKPAGKIHFARSLPIDKARRPEVLLAYRMNGAELPSSHGFPLRAVVPGWYGMASIKWLTRIVLVDRPFQGHFQSVDYAYWERRDGLPTRTPLGEMRIKSEIARPEMHEVIRKGTAYRVFGAAWSGESTVSKVEVSIDAGQSYAETRLIGNAVPFAWRLWEFDWRVPEKVGRYTLMSKATDVRSRTQPLERDRDFENYMIHQVLPIDVDVR